MGKKDNDRVPGSLWRGAWAYVDVLRNLADKHDSRRELTLERTELPGILLASAITRVAHAMGITTVTEPGELAELNLGQANLLLGTAGQIELMVHMSTNHDPLSLPTSGDGGYEAWTQLKATMDDLNAGGAQGALEDPGRVKRIQEYNEQVWDPAREDARGIIMVAFTHTPGVTAQTPAVLGLWANDVAGT